MRSAVIVAVPEAAGAVDHWREQTCSDKPSVGVPPHITLVFPFVPADQLNDEAIASLAAVASATAAFEFELRTTARFPAVLYLEPEPAATFTRLTEAIVRRFPEYPPYEGAFDVVVPHLTVAQGEAPLLAEVEVDVARLLPISAVAHELVLLEEIEPDSGRWQVRARLPLSRSSRTAR